MLSRQCAKPHCQSNGNDRVNASVPFSSCAACLGVAYCGSTCQSVDWKRHGTTECKHMKQISRLVRLCDPDEAKTVTDNVRVIDSKSNLGRVVVATCEFAIGDAVFHEDPLLVWIDDNNNKNNNNNNNNKENNNNNNNGDSIKHAQHSAEGILIAFSNASPGTRARILDLSHPPESSITGPSISEWNELQTLCEHLGLDISLDTAQRLLLIKKCNSHGFSGAARQLDASVSASALFSIASKVEHSCTPNVQMDSESGHLVFTAIRPIRAGERVTFAYTCTTQDTQTRQRSLQSSKMIWCDCERCLVPDASRPLVCCQAGCSGFALRNPTRSPAQDENEGTWECLTCHQISLDDEIIQFEQKLLANYQDVEHLRLAKQRPVGLAIRRASEVQQLASQLPPLHYLHGLCHALVRRSASSEITLIEQATPKVRESLFPEADDCTEHIQKLNNMAMSEALKLLVWREKLEAVIDGRKDSDLGWPSDVDKTPDVAVSIDAVLEQIWESWADPFLYPSQTSAKDAFDAGIELINAKTPSMDLAAAHVFRRYKAEILSWLPAEDPDTRRVRELLAKFPDTRSSAAKPSPVTTGFSFSRLIDCMV